MSSTAPRREPGRPGGDAAPDPDEPDRDAPGRAGDRPDPPVQRTVGRWITLRPVRPADYDFIRSAELSDDLGLRWRHRGATPSPEAFAHALWAGVLAQFLVVANADHRVVGLVSAYDPDLRAGTCFVGFARFDPHDRSPGLVEAVLLLTDHLFAHWPFRKLYGETIEFNLADLGGVLGPLLVEEGRLREHVFAGGRHWDLCYLALYRDTWLAHRDRLLPRPGASGPDDGSGVRPARRLTVSLPASRP
jgi:RimJ/RimL family protein N-acetyltransferase